MIRQRNILWKMKNDVLTNDRENRIGLYLLTLQTEYEYMKVDETEKDAVNICVFQRKPLTLQRHKNVTR